jgi:hypothetical protein
MLEAIRTSVAQWLSRSRAATKKPGTKPGF